MRYLGKDLINKYILKCYFGHFISITKTVSSAITRDHEHMEFEDDTSDVKKECEDDAVANILLKNLSKIIIVNEKMKNEDFFSQFKSYVNCVFDWLMVRAIYK